jgi:hypothetical protein
MRLQDPVAEPILAPGPRAFVPVSVDLDHQPPVGPMEVDLDVLDGGVTRTPGILTSSNLLWNRTS